MQPNRQEQLDFITHKIARTGGGTGPGETGYYLPVMIGDVLDWMENIFLPRTYENTTGYKYPKHTPIYPALHVEVFYKIWKTKREPIDKQSDDCISYIYKLISHA